MSGAVITQFTDIYLAIEGTVLSSAISRTHCWSENLLSVFVLLKTNEFNEINVNSLIIFVMCFSTLLTQLCAQTTAQHNKQIVPLDNHPKWLKAIVYLNINQFLWVVRLCSRLICLCGLRPNSLGSI